MPITFIWSQLIHSRRALRYDHLDEITSAFSVKFSVGGDKILVSERRRGGRI